MLSSDAQIVSVPVGLCTHEEIIGPEQGSILATLFTMMKAAAVPHLYDP